MNEQKISQHVPIWASISVIVSTIIIAGSFLVIILVPGPKISIAHKTPPAIAMYFAPIGWQDYTNSVYIFSLKHPTDYSLSDSSNITISSKNIASASIKMIFTPSKMTYNQLAAFSLAGNDAKNFSVTDVTIGNLLAKKIQIIHDCQLNLASGGKMILNNNETVYLVRNGLSVGQIVLGEKDWQQLETTFNQIVSTFEFK